MNLSNIGVEKELNKSTEIIKKEIAERIKQRRKTMGISQEQVAQELGLGRAAYAKKETCISNFKIYEIVKLSIFFGVSTCWLLEGDVEKKGGLNKDENRVVNAYRSLDEKGRHKLLLFAMDMILADAENNHS